MGGIHSGVTMKAISQVTHGAGNTIIDGAETRVNISIKVIHSHADAALLMISRHVCRLMNRLSNFRQRNSSKLTNHSRNHLFSLGRKFADCSYEIGNSLICMQTHFVCGESRTEGGYSVAFCQ